MAPDWPNKSPLDGDVARNGERPATFDGVDAEAWGCVAYSGGRVVVKRVDGRRLVAYPRVALGSSMAEHMAGAVGELLGAYDSIMKGGACKGKAAILVSGKLRACGMQFAVRVDGPDVVAFVASGADGPDFIRGADAVSEGLEAEARGRKRYVVYRGKYVVTEYIEGIGMVARPREGVEADGDAIMASMARELLWVFPAIARRVEGVARDGIRLNGAFYKCGTWFVPYVEMEGMMAFKARGADALRFMRAA